MRRLYPLLNVLQALFLVCWSIFWISAALVVMLLTLDRDAPLAMARRFWAPGLRWGALTTIERAPLPKLDFAQPHIFAMNHQSMLDIVVAFIAIPVNLRFIAKAVLKYVPFLGWYMWLTGMVFIDRRRSRRAVRGLELAGKHIRDGANILVYPEGTRSRDGGILPFKKGPFALAIKSQVPIVPVAVEGSGVCLPSGGFNLRKGTVRVKLGEPIPTAGLTDRDREQLVQRVREALIDLHLTLGGKGGDKGAALNPAEQAGALTGS